MTEWIEASVMGFDPSKYPMSPGQHSDLYITTAADLVAMLTCCGYTMAGAGLEESLCKSSLPCVSDGLSTSYYLH